MTSFMGYIILVAYKRDFSLKSLASIIELNLYKVQFFNSHMIRLISNSHVKIEL